MRKNTLDTVQIKYDGEIPVAVGVHYLKDHYGTINFREYKNITPASMGRLKKLSCRPDIRTGFIFSVDRVDAPDRLIVFLRRIES